MKPSIENTRMQRESVSKLGGVCSGLMGISYLLVGIIYFLQPAAQRTSIASTDENLLRFYLSMAQSPATHTILHALLALISVLAFASVPACVGPVNDLSEAVADAQVRHRGMIATAGGREVGPAPPLRFEPAPAE